MRFYTTLLKIAAAGVLLVAPIFAQSGADIRVDVPFAFRVGAQTLPAGEYRLHADPGSPLMLIQDGDRKYASMTLTGVDQSTSGPDVPQVRFRVYGETRYLAGVWIPNAIGRTLPKSPAERETAVEYAKAETVTVAASR